MEYSLAKKSMDKPKKSAYQYDYLNSKWIYLG
jgi:hypothetical protein